MYSNLISAIEKAIKLNASFCVYRIPGKEEIFFGADDNSDSIYAQEFIAVPFDINRNKSTAVKCRVTDIDEFISKEITRNNNKYQILDRTPKKAQYIASIEKTVDYINQGHCKKIVYSGTEYSRHHKTPKDWANDYLSLCKTYPNAFVFLFKTNDTNFWMGATPEIILCNKNGIGETMSLAGTRKANTKGPWGDKEIEEQNIVTEYIKNTINKNELKYTVSDTFTKNAGNIEHLCNKFEIDLKKTETLNHLLSDLHPTPAISGFPKEKAIDYLKNNEPHNRKYYGGFCGPKQDQYSFSYYVILRCIEFNDIECCLYAGGGITSDSVAANEWEEINNKMNTLKKILGNANS